MHAYQRLETPLLTLWFGGPSSLLWVRNTPTALGNPIIGAAVAPPCGSVYTYAPIAFRTLVPRAVVVSCVHVHAYRVSKPHLLALWYGDRSSLLCVRTAHVHGVWKPRRSRCVVVAPPLQVVCEATQCTDANVRKAAYEAIWTIATLYYDRLQVSSTRWPCCAVPT